MKPAHRLISLASGTVPEFSPVAVVEAAAAAGFGGCGVWFDAAAFTPETVRDLRAAFAATGIRALEIEVLVVGDPERERYHAALLEAGAEVGATEAIVVSRERDPARCADVVAALVERARVRGIRLSLEFLPMYVVGDLDAALAVRAAVGEELTLLLDPLHVARAGARLDAIRRIPWSAFRFAQLCDAVGAAPGDGGPGALRDEALNGRLLPGEGELPLAELLRCLPPALPLSLEVRSARLREAFPELRARARAVFDATARWLARDRAG